MADGAPLTEQHEYAIRARATRDRELGTRRDQTHHDKHCVTDRAALLNGIKSLRTRLVEAQAAFETRQKKGGVTISTHALHNLEGAIIDIERQGKADAVSLRTLKRVAEQLGCIARALSPTPNQETD